MNVGSSGEVLSWTSQLDSLGVSKTCSEIGSELNLFRARAQDQGQEGAVKFIDYERQACLLTASATIIRSYERAETDVVTRFSGLVGYSDGSQWPDPDGFGEEALQYLRRRGEETPNPVLKARYLDFVGEKQISADKYRLTLAAIDAYLTSAEGFSLSDQVSHQLEMVDAMDQATFLALKFGSVEKLTRVVKIILELIKRQALPESSSTFGSLPRGRWALELSRILLYVRGSRKYGKHVTNAQLEQMKSIMADLAEQNKHDRFAQRRLLESVSSAAHFLGLGEEEYLLELQRGEALVQQGEASEQEAGNGPRHLIAAHFYENAVLHYQRMRERLMLTAKQNEDLAQRENELKVRIRRMYQLGRSELSRFAVPIEFSPQEQAELEYLLDDLTSQETLAECLQRVATEGTLLPNLKSAEEAASETKENASVLALFPKRSLRDDITISVAESEPQKFSQSVRDNLLFWIQINSTVVLTELFERLREHKGLSAETLAAYFAETGLFQEKSLPLIGSGLERHFAGDYVSALHVLVPQYEDALRSLFEQSGQGIIRSRSKNAGWEYETFGAFLEREEIKQVLPAEFLIYIRLVMSEVTGWNLRNRIAHGLVHALDCNIVTSVTVIHLYLLLTLFRSDKGA